MDTVELIDVSHWQGTINWAAVDRPAAIIKCSGGDAGLYYDSQCSTNYYGAQGAGKATGLYHFAGGGDPVAEANFFVSGVKPLVQYDFYVLDWEQGITTHPNAVAWCQSFLQQFYNQVGVWPMIYLNLSTLKSYDWSWVLARCGLWIAAPSYSPDSDVPTNGIEYIMQQYGSPTGLAGLPTGTACDVDRFFGALTQLKKYGYNGNVTPTPPPPPAPVITTGEVTETDAIPFTETTVTDPTVAVGTSTITQAGVDGIETKIYTVTYADNVEQSRTLTSDTITTPMIPQITTVGSMIPTPPDPTPPTPPDPTPPAPNPPHKYTLLELLKAIYNGIISFLKGGK